MGKIKIPNAKLKGSTLIEVLVALVIITVVSGIAVITYVRMLNYQDTPALQLQQQLSIIAHEAVRQGEKPVDQHYALPNDVVVEQHVSPYPSHPDLLLLQLDAYQEQQHLGTYRTLISPNPYEAP